MLFCIPNSCTVQVKGYFYRLKGQLQKHNPGRDIDELTQKEIFQAMGFMWSTVSSTCLLHVCVTKLTLLLAAFLHHDTDGCLDATPCLDKGDASQS